MGKINLQLAVKNAMRKRLLTINGIDAKRIQLPNTVFKKPSCGAWIRESFNEGDEEPRSNAAGREYMVVNYEIFCKASIGADSVDNIVESIRKVLPVIGAQSVIYWSDCQSAFIKSIDKPAGGIDGEEPTWYRRLVAITVELCNP